MTSPDLPRVVHVISRWGGLQGKLRRSERVITVVRVYTPIPASMGKLRVCVRFSEQCTCACVHPQQMLSSRTRLMDTKNSSWELQRHNPDLEENKLFDLSL